MKHWKNTTGAWVTGTAAFLSSAAVFGVAEPNTPPTTGTAVGHWGLALATNPNQYFGDGGYSNADPD